MIWEKKLQPYLKASQCDFKWHVQWPVDDSSYRLNEGHEEQWEPDDTDQQHYNHPSHAIFHHLLLLLASRLGIPLWRDEMKDGEVYYLTSMQNGCSFFCRLCLSNFTFFLLQQTWFYMCSMSGWLLKWRWNKSLSGRYLFTTVRYRMFIVILEI